MLYAYSSSNSFLCINISLFVSKFSRNMSSHRYQLLLYKCKLKTHRLVIDEWLAFPFKCFTVSYNTSHFRGRKFFVPFSSGSSVGVSRKSLCLSPVALYQSHRVLYFLLCDKKPLPLVIIIYESLHVLWPFILTN